MEQMHPPIDLTEIDANWYRISEKCMLSGGTILIFPEGDIAREGKMLSFQPGAGLLSAKTGAAIVPVASYGDYHLLFGKRQILRIGVPIESDCPSNVRHSVYAKQLIHQAEVKVKQLYGTLEQEHGRIGTYPNESYAPAAKSI